MIAKEGGGCCRALGLVRVEQERRSEGKWVGAHPCSPYQVSECVVWSTVWRVHSCVVLPTDLSTPSSSVRDRDPLRVRHYLPELNHGFFEGDQQQVLTVRPVAGSQGCFV